MILKGSLVEDALQQVHAAQCPRFALDKERNLLLNSVRSSSSASSSPHVILYDVHSSANRDWVLLGPGPRGNAQNQIRACVTGGELKAMAVARRLPPGWVPGSYEVCTET